MLRSYKRNVAWCNSVDIEIAKLWLSFEAESIGDCVSQCGRVNRKSIRPHSSKLEESKLVQCPTYGRWTFGCLYRRFCLFAATFMPSSLDQLTSTYILPLSFPTSHVEIYDHCWPITAKLTLTLSIRYQGLSPGVC